MPQYFNNVQQFLQVKGYIPPLENRSQLSAKVKKKIRIYNFNDSGKDVMQTFYHSFKHLVCRFLFSLGKIGMFRQNTCIPTLGKMF